MFCTGPPGLDRQYDGEFAALARRAVHCNLAAVGLHDMAHQRKSQAAAFRVVHQRIAHAIELLENLLLLLMRYANPLVHHFQFYRAVVAIQVHADVLSVLRILERVVHQVQQ